MPDYKFAVVEFKYFIMPNEFMAWKDSVSTAYQDVVDSVEVFDKSDCLFDLLREVVTQCVDVVRDYDGALENREGIIKAIEEVDVKNVLETGLAIRGL